MTNNLSVSVIAAQIIATSARLSEQAMSLIEAISCGEPDADGKSLANSLYAATLDVVVGGVDALYAAERTYEVVIAKDRLALERICDELEGWARLQHQFINELQKLRYTADLMESASVPQEPPTDGVV